LVCAAWTLIFSIPVLRVIRDHPDASRGGGESARGLVAHLLVPVKKLAASYRRLWGTITELWHLERTTVYFLGASAIFRDGLAGVFTFDRVIAAVGLGYRPGDVSEFGAVATVVPGSD